MVSNPEFLREGTAVKDFLHPDRIVVGANNERSAEVLRRIYEPLTDGSYYAQPGALPGACSADASRAADRDFDAERGDYQARVECISGDEDFVHQRRGQPGRSRGCGHRRHCRGHRARQPHRSQVSARGAGVWRLLFPKDVAAFHWVAQERGVDFQLLEEVRKINETQKEVFFNKVRSALWTLRGKRLAALGLAFKGETDDIRDSPAIDMIKKLLQCGRDCDGLRSGGDGARQRSAAARGEHELCERSV